MSLFLWLLIYAAVVTPFAILMVPKVHVWTAPLYFVLIFASCYAVSFVPGVSG